MYRQESGDWKCQKCNKMNFKKRMQCFGCSAPKISEIRRRSGNKICRNCQDLNFANRTVCRKCGHSLSDSVEQVPVHSRGYIETLLKCIHGYISGSFQPVNDTSTSFREGDWNCNESECKAHNFASRDVCYKRHSPKPDLIRNPDDSLTYTGTSIGDNEDTETTEQNCPICFSEPKTHAITKCGHLACCGTCVYAMDICPICREPYDPDNDIIQIFVS